MNKGYLIILTGYIGWGLFPLYWSLLAHIAPLEVLLHRILWSTPVLLLLVSLSLRRRQQVMSAFRSWPEVRLLAISSFFICANWGIYIWAVANHRVIEASMGYFLTPLLNVIAGLIFFGEKLNRLKLIAIGFAALGVAYYISNIAEFPWVALGVGFSFASYGLLRKKMDTNAVPGLLVETLLLLPFTLAALIWLHLNGQAMFLNLNSSTDLLLVLGGPITVIPLAFFTSGTRLLPMTSVGILFYVTPTLQFLSGVMILGEAFNQDKLIGFAGIWIGLAIFTFSLILGHSNRQKRNPTEIG
ncbi:MAG: chloramphenicol-sensitive protein RarD [Gammaproteobacteria bacterium]|jgi:chloramphenicol-sensitive protein RarD